MSIRERFFWAITGVVLGSGLTVVAVYA